MKQRELVTVIIPVYNAGDYLATAVRSILGQTYRDLEVLIVDDGSTDGAVERCESMLDGRCRVLRQSNAGKAVAMNRAFDHMSGSYFAIQDADDISHPERIEQQVAFLEKHSRLAAVFTGHDLLYGSRRFGPHSARKAPRECREDVNAYRIPAHDATPMFRAQQVEGFRFDPRFRIGQGIDFILKVGEQHDFAVLGKCLYTYRCSEASTIHRDPTKRASMITQVMTSAYERRKAIGYAPLNQPPSIGVGKTSMSHVVTHSIESVLETKRKNPIAALATCIQCICMNPYNPFHYKPFGFFCAPLHLVAVYRHWKASRL